MRATTSRRRRFPWVIMVGLCAAVPACKSPPRPSFAPADVESIDDAERALADNERRLAQLGIIAKAATHGGDTSPVDSASGQPEAEAESAPQPSSPSPPSPVDAAAASRDEDAEDLDDAMSPRCSRICDLAASSCQLAQQICELAAGHVGQARYDNACRNAQAQCELASEACRGCA